MYVSVLLVSKSIPLRFCKNMYVIVCVYMYACTYLSVFACTCMHCYVFLWPKFDKRDGKHNSLSYPGVRRHNDLTGESSRWHPEVGHCQSAGIDGMIRVHLFRKALSSSHLFPSHPYLSVHLYLSVYACMSIRRLHIYKSFKFYNI